MPAGFTLWQHLETFKEFPSRQAPAEFNPEKLLEYALKVLPTVSSVNRSRRSGL